MSTLAEKEKAFRRLVARLPATEQQVWMRRLQRAKRALAARVSGDDITLDFANWLDRAYRAVSDRVVQVAKQGAATAESVRAGVTHGVADTAGKLGSSFVLPVLLGVGALLAWGYVQRSK